MWNYSNKRPNSQRGSSLLELLFVVLIIGLIAAGVISSLLKARQDQTIGLPDPKNVLDQWTRDPETMTAEDASARTEDHQASYDELVQQLKDGNLLQIMPPESTPPASLATAPQSPATTFELPEIDFSKMVRGDSAPPLDPDEVETDPDLVWSDGQPATILKKSN
jgi:hypothetical protein